MRRIKQFLKSKWFPWSVLTGVVIGVGIGEYKTWHDDV